MARPVRARDNAWLSRFRCPPPPSRLASILQAKATVNTRPRHGRSWCRPGIQHYCVNIQILCRRVSTYLAHSEVGEVGGRCTAGNLERPRSSFLVPRSSSCPLLPTDRASDGKMSNVECQETTMGSLSCLTIAGCLPPHTGAEQMGSKPSRPKCQWLLSKCRKPVLNRGGGGFLTGDQPSEGEGAVGCSRARCSVDGLRSQ
ncbi:hypothetical protein B0T19DRAFT_43710 [Cercophora scortea]|uniref:Uncharacterized protein n=1 Tax=Cercophora scortea TaxID=314031 RepID=A0AAE0J468_9PEZI|nr:hypothetical protein B0T19DRAFT_43710 [Cercophora scortea]